ncbi:MAG TPA: type II secretion system F family protein [Acidimicrobiia bacterium]|nr:type II secretion system F family protein [Acidimicrobiia bacterium]
MTGAIMTGIAVAVGVPWVIVGVAVASMVEPWFGILCLLALFVLRRDSAARWSVDIRFCRGMADELRSGSSLRRALETSARDIDEHRLARACRIGRPFDELATAVEACLPLVGRAAANAVRIAGESGGRVADTFEAIALLASDEHEMSNERRVATAQVRMSAAVIAVLPLILLVILAATGRMDALTSGGSVTLWFLAAGFVLIAAGLLSIWRMVHLAERV